MIVEVKAYKAVCDGCGASVPAGVRIETVALYVDMQGWELARDGTVTCDACLTVPVRKKKEMKK